MSWLEVALRGLPERGDVIRIIDSDREELIDCELAVLAASPGEIDAARRGPLPLWTPVWPDRDRWEVIDKVWMPPPMGGSNPI